MAPAEIPTAGSDQPYLLLVEDSATSLAVISSQLSGYFDFISAKNGEEAWELLQNDPKIELVITDVNMPKLSGLELLKRIRDCKDSKISELPVFIMTANDDETGKHEALVNGANDFITKPINPLVLRARVNVHYKVAEHARRSGQVVYPDLPATDPLTSFYTKDSFMELAQKTIDTYLEQNKLLALLVIEIEKYHELNKSLGAQAGEEALQTAAKLLNKLVRDIDIVGRIGDNQFAVLLPNTKQLGTTIASQRIRTTIERMELQIEDQSVNITASIGVTMIPDDTTTSVLDLLQLTETRLTTAKNLGGNRICVNEKGDEDFSG